MASRLLDIVVTHYNEPWEIVRPFFDILNAQRCVDMSLFKVWFVQDGPSVDIFPKRYFDGSKLDVEWVTIPHSGVSAARNAGMDKADSEWICFCDCDDCFTGIFCLKMLAYILKPDQPYDLMWNPFCMNVMAMDDVVIMQDVYNRIWIHNKYYRLSFLRENNLRFPEWIHFGEDSAFNNILDLYIQPDRIGKIQTGEPMYAWVRRENSTTNDPKKALSNIEGHFERNLYVLGEYEKKGHPKTSYYIARTVTDAWATLTKYPGLKETERITKRVAGFYSKYGDIYENLPEKLKAHSKEISEKDAGTTKMDIPGRPTLEEWIEFLKKEEKDSI